MKKGSLVLKNGFPREKRPFYRVKGLAGDLFWTAVKKCFSHHFSNLQETFRQGETPSFYAEAV